MNKINILIAVLVLALVMLGIFLIDDKGPSLEKDFERTELELKVYLYDSQRELSDAYREHYNDPSLPDRQAWAGWNKEEPYCEVHIPRLRGQEDLEYKILMGHELAHCIWGSYHPE